MNTVTSELSGALKELYNTFILRDLLGKFVPSFLFITSITKMLMNHEDLKKMFDLLSSSNQFQSVMSWILVISISYTIGFCIQTLSEIVGLNSAHPMPLTFLTKKEGKIAREEFRQRLVLFKGQTDILPLQAQQRERLVIIKDLTGNMILPFVTITVYFLFFDKKISVVFFVLSILLYVTHKFHRERQYEFEKGVFELIKVYPDYYYKYGNSWTVKV